MKLWKFRTKNFIVTCFTEPDAFDSSYMEPSLVKECREKLRSGEWKCFQTTVQVKHRLSGEVLAESYLGNSIYADPKEFARERIGIRAKSRQDGTNYGCYFTGMVKEAISDARERLKELRAERRSALDRLEEGNIREVKP